MTRVHPLIQTARGHVADEDWAAAERVLARAVDAAKDLEHERDRYRAALNESEYLHVDLLRVYPLEGLPPKLVERRVPDDPAIGRQVRDGTATYVAMSEPHTMADCPYRPGEDR